jgi:hypothetical protein
VACKSATDGALIEWRREEVEGSVQGAGAIILFEVLEVSPRLNPSPLREPAAMEIYVGVSRRDLFRRQAKNNPLAKINESMLPNHASDDPDFLTLTWFKSTEIVLCKRGLAGEEFGRTCHRAPYVRGERWQHH